jgi:hypothetical protein
MGSPFGSKGNKSSGKGKNGFPQGGNGGNLQPAKGLGFDNQAGKRGLGNTQLTPDKKGLGGAELEADPTLNRHNPSSDILPKNNINANELRTLNIDDTATYIEEGAFRNTTNLQGTITGGNDITNIGPFSFMGSGAIELGNLLSGLTENVGQGAFVNSGVKGPIFLPQNIKTVGSEAFRSTKISSLIITGNELQSIDSNAFRDCLHLKTIHIEVGPQVFVGTGHFQIGSSRHKTIVKYIEVDTTNSTVLGLPKKKWLMRPSVPEKYYYMSTDWDAEDPSTAPEVEYEGTILIEWENCNRWIIGVDDNNPDTIGEIFQKNGILNPIDYYDPSPEIPYVGVVTSNGEVRVKIQDRDKPDPPTQGLILYVPAVHFYDYNCGTFRAQTGFTGEIRSR